MARYDKNIKVKTLVLLRRALKKKTPTGSSYESELSKIALDPNTSEEVLVELARDRYRAQHLLIENPKTPQEVLVSIFKIHQNNMNYIRKLMLNPKCPLYIIERVHSSNADIRERMARNANTPTTILKRLSEDSCIHVKTYAMKELSRRESTSS